MRPFLLRQYLQRTVQIVSHGYGCVGAGMPLTDDDASMFIRYRILLPGFQYLIIKEPAEKVKYCH